MRWLLAAVFAFGMIGTSVPTFAQTIGEGVIVTQATDAEVVTVAGETGCTAEVCADRALDPRCDKNFWNGMAWCPAKPTTNNGDVAPVTFVRFTRTAIQNGYFIRHTAMKDVRLQRDEAYIMWEIDPITMNLQADVWYKVTGGDRNKCQNADNSKSYYTHAEGVTFSSVSNRESVNRDISKKCDGGHWL